MFSDQSSVFLVVSFLGFSDQCSVFLVVRFFSVQSFLVFSSKIVFSVRCSVFSDQVLVNCGQNLVTALN